MSFIILVAPNKDTVTTIKKGDHNIIIFASEADARKQAHGNILCQRYPYQIIELGTAWR